MKEKRAEHIRKLTCIVCPVGCSIEVDTANNYATTGNQCLRGAKYAYAEITAPTRVVTSTVIIEHGLYQRLPVKTAEPIPKELVLPCMQTLAQVVVQAPVSLGDVIVSDLLGTGIDVVATRSMVRV